MEFIHQLRNNHKGKKIALILDNASYHRSKYIKNKLLSYPEVKLFNLPTYSPEYNPVEQIWKWLKNNIHGSRSVVNGIVDIMSGLAFTRKKYYARIYYKENGKQREKKINLITSNKEKALELKESIDQQEKLFKQGTINLDDIKVKEPTDLEKMIEEHRQYLEVSGKAETGRVTEVPFKITKLPVKQKKPRYFSDAEMEMILEEASVNNELHARICVHWKTGIRLSEIHNSYIENGFLKTYDPIKKGQERSIPIDSEVRKQYSIATDGDYTIIQYPGNSVKY